MSNEEKILEELKNIRAELATVRAEVEELKATRPREEPMPTLEEQRKAFIELSQLFTDEEAESFGKYMDEIERQKGIID